MTDQLKWTVGDTAPPLTGTAIANTTTGAVLDLSTSTEAIIHIARPDRSIISRAVTHTGILGAWSLPLTVGDLTVAGQYMGELQITWGDGTIQTIPGLTFPVRSQIA